MIKLNWLRPQILLIAVIFVLVSLILTACEFPFLPRRTTPTTGKVTLTYWGLWEPEEITRSVIASYQNSHPNVTIKYEKQSPQQYLERLKTKIAAGTGPDIFRFHNTWVGALRTELAPLPTEVMDKATYQKTFYPVFYNDLTIGNNIVGIPLEFDGLALYYNEDIFRTANIGKPPSTWDELRTTASALTVRDQTGNIRTAGVALGTANNVDHFSDILGLMFYQNGVDFSKPLEKSGDRAVDTLKFYTIFATADQKVRVWDSSLPSSTIAFASGQLAMYFGPSWRVFEIKAANPSLNFKIIPVPQLPGERVTWASYWAEGVSTKSSNSKEAWEFLKFLSSAEALQNLYGAASAARLFGEPYSRIDLAPALLTDPYVGAYVTSAPTAKSWYFASATHDNGINEKNIKALIEAVQQINANAPVESTLKKLSQQTEEN